MIKKLFLFACIVFISTELFAQNRDSTKATTLSLNLPGIIDVFDANITFGIDFKIAKLISAGIDAGYIYASIYTSDAQSTSGILLRPYIRFYFDKKEELFFQAQLHYKSVTYTKESWVNRDFVNGVPSFSQLGTISNYKKAYGIHCLIGIRKQLSGSNDHLLLESTFGLGYRYKKQYSDNGLFSTTGFVFGSRNNNSTPVLLMNLKLCYKL